MSATTDFLFPTLFFCCERLSASMARSLHLSFICIPQSTRALDQGGVEPRQAVSPKALRPWTIPLRTASADFLFPTLNLTSTIDKKGHAEGFKKYAFFFGNLRGFFGVHLLSSWVFWSHLGSCWNDICGL